MLLKRPVLHCLSCSLVLISLCLVVPLPGNAEVAPEQRGLVQQLQEQGLLSPEEAAALLQRLVAQAEQVVIPGPSPTPPQPEVPLTDHERRLMLEVLQEQGLVSDDEARSVRVRMGIEVAAAPAEQPVSAESESPVQQTVKPAEPEQGEFSFPIRSFYISGNSIFPDQQLYDLLTPFTGDGKKSVDVEAARDRLEQFFHENGYPAVLVNIPEQSTEGGSIQLQVLEGRVGMVTVTGNRFFSTAMIKERLPSLTPGSQVSSAAIKRDFTAINQHADRKVIPGMAPGKEPGTVDFELKVEDRSPLHASLELNNKAGHNTEELRLVGTIRHDNLWQRDHSLSLQYQTAPQDMEQVKVATGSYLLPVPGTDGHRLILYGLWTDSDTPVGDGFRSTGKGTVFGARYLLPLAGQGSYNHSLSLGLDYKDFEDVIISGSDDVVTPVTYLPLSLGYSASLFDAESKALTLLNAGVSLTFRGAVTDQTEFSDKRYNGRANYLTLNMGVEHRRPVWSDYEVRTKLDGQLASEPLISNEEFAAGGMDSVRGYRESEALGDSGIHGSFEALAPDLGKLAGLKQLVARPYLFYDIASLWVMDPLPGQEEFTLLHGAGIGVRGVLTERFEYQLDGAFALKATNRTESGDNRVHFKLKLQW